METEFFRNGIFEFFLGKVLAVNENIVLQKSKKNGVGSSFFNVFVAIADFFPIEVFVCCGNFSIYLSYVFGESFFAFINSVFLLLARFHCNDEVVLIAAQESGCFFNR